MLGNQVRHTVVPPEFQCRGARPEGALDVEQVGPPVAPDVLLEQLEPEPPPQPHPGTGGARRCPSPEAQRREAGVVLPRQLKAVVTKAAAAERTEAAKIGIE